MNNFSEQVETAFVFRFWLHTTDGVIFTPIDEAPGFPGVAEKQPLPPLPLDEPTREPDIIILSLPAPAVQEETSGDMEITLLPDTADDEAQSTSPVDSMDSQIILLPDEKSSVSVPSQNPFLPLSPQAGDQQTPDQVPIVLEDQILNQRGIELTNALNQTCAVWAEVYGRTNSHSIDTVQNLRHQIIDQLLIFAKTYPAKIDDAWVQQTILTRLDLCDFQSVIDFVAIPRPPEEIDRQIEILLGSSDKPLQFDTNNGRRIEIEAKIGYRTREALDEHDVAVRIKDRLRMEVSHGKIESQEDFQHFIHNMNLKEHFALDSPQINFLSVKDTTPKFSVVLGQGKELRILQTTTGDTYSLAEAIVHCSGITSDIDTCKQICDHLELVLVREVQKVTGTLTEIQVVEILKNVNEIKAFGTTIDGVKLPVLEVYSVPRPIPLEVELKLPNEKSYIAQGDLFGRILDIGGPSAQADWTSPELKRPVETLQNRLVETLQRYLQTRAARSNLPELKVEDCTEWIHQFPFFKEQSFALERAEMQVNESDFR